MTTEPTNVGIPNADHRRAIALNDVADALLHYRRGHVDPYASQHEGWAIILEHTDALWYQVRFGTPASRRAAAVALACTTLRFLSDFDDTVIGMGAASGRPMVAYRITTALNDADAELRDAMDKFGPFASAYEGYAVILEEVLEMRHEVMHGPPVRAHEEAVQVAAMALRFLVDIPVNGGK